MLNMEVTELEFLKFAIDIVFILMTQSRLLQLHFPSLVCALFEYYCVFITVLMPKYNNPPQSGITRQGYDMVPLITGKFSYSCLRWRRIVGDGEVTMAMVTAMLGCDNNG